MKNSKKTSILALVLVVVLLFTLCACGSSKLVGTWLGEYGQTFQFKKGGKGVFTEEGYYGSDSDPFTYKTKGKKLIIKYDNEDFTRTYEYKVSGKNLTLKSEWGETFTFYKVK